MAWADWSVDMEKLQAPLYLYPTHAERHARLHELQSHPTRRSSDLTGQQHCDAGQWQAALEAFRRVQTRGGHYKDVEALIATAQRELAQVRDEERRRVRMGTR